MGDGAEAPMTVLALPEERKPVEQVADQKDEEGPFEYFLQKSAVTHQLIFFHGKAHGVAYGKEEGREDQVGRGTSVPMGMPEGGIGKFFAAGCVDDDHKTHGHSPEDVKGQGSGRGLEDWSGLSHLNFCYVSELCAVFKFAGATLRHQLMGQWLPY